MQYDDYDKSFIDLSYLDSLVSLGKKCWERQKQILFLIFVNRVDCWIERGETQ